MKPESCKNLIAKIETRRGPRIRCRFAAEVDNGRGPLFDPRMCETCDGESMPRAVRLCVDRVKARGTMRRLGIHRDAATVESYRAICRRCPEHSEIGGRIRCKLCGCGDPASRRPHCPAFKWGDDDAYRAMQAEAIKRQGTEPDARPSTRQPAAQERKER